MTCFSLCADDRGCDQQKQQGDIVTTASSACDQCGSVFQDPDELDNHIRLHCPVPQECKICSKTFANVYRLQRHMISHEESTELRKFKCPECAKAFKFKHHLKEHIRIHSGEKPFECPNCGKRFSHSGSYSSHMTSKKCWVGNFGNGKIRKSPAESSTSPLRQNDVLRPLVPKGDEQKNGVGIDPAVHVYQAMYQNLVTAAGMGVMDPALQQYTMAMRNIFPFPGAAGSPVINPLLFHHHHLIHNKPNMQQAEDAPAEEKSLNEEAHIKCESVDDMDKSADHLNGDEESQKSVEENGNKEDEKENELQTKDCKDEPIDASDNVMESAEHEMNDVDNSAQESKLDSDAEHTKEEVEEEGAEGEGEEERSLRCRFCLDVFASPISLHQHERYMCTHNRELHSSPLHIVTSLADGALDDAGLKRGSSHTPTSEHGSDDSHSCRVRSILSDAQKRLLEAQYILNPWPAKVDMERLASETGLARRVIQVWFQNCRARDRRKGKVIPDRPVSGATGSTRGDSSFSEQTASPPQQHPYIPRVPKITLSANASFSYFPHSSPVMQPTTPQLEPLDLSTKPNDTPSDHALNLSTKPDTAADESVLRFLQREGALFPSTSAPAVNTTPAHSHQTALAGSNLISSPTSSQLIGSPPSSQLMSSPPCGTLASSPAIPPAAVSPPGSVADPVSSSTPHTPAGLMDLIPRSTSTPHMPGTPHRCSPAVFPTLEPMIPSSPTASHSSSLDASFTSSFSENNASATESGSKRKAWRIHMSMKLDDDDLEAGDDADTDTDHPLSSGSKKRKSWKQHRVIEAGLVGESSGSGGMYACDQCDKLFNKQSSLARHKYEHSGQRPFPCDVCGKAFKHKHHLTEHKRLHSGEKPFECTKCGKRFSHSGSYSQHMNHRYKYCKPLMAGAEGGAAGAESDSNNSDQQVQVPVASAAAPVMAAV